MAHLKKNTRGAVPGLAVHFERKTDHHTNKEIDVSKAYLNQDLMADGSDMLSRFNARLNDVYCMKRDDVKALAIWIVTLPEELAEAPYEQQSAFFEATTAFLNDRYGQENAVAAVVHYDETTLTCTMPLFQWFLMIKNHVIKSPLKKCSRAMIYKPFMRI
ncbi:plasmid recombination protein [Listeria monocytogenes]|nr:plasmid recombination protein [Listeria monocytogenes]EJA9854526.1 plasmid recombination protein [Listeria monocytogenes]